MSVELTTEQMVAQVMSGFLPLLISVVMQPTWSTRTRTIVSFVITLAVLIAVQLAFIAVADVPSTGRGWAQFLFFGVIAVQGSYRWIWSQVGATQRIEAATSPDGTEAQRAAKARLLNEATRKVKPPREPGS